MKITVKLFATFRIGRFNQAEREYPDGVTCLVVIEDLGIEEEKLRTVLVFVNGRYADRGQILKEGDTLSLLPLVGGG